MTGFLETKAFIENFEPDFLNRFLRRENNFNLLDLFELASRLEGDRDPSGPRFRCLGRQWVEWQASEAAMHLTQLGPSGVLDSFVEDGDLSSDIKAIDIVRNWPKLRSG